MPGPFDNVGPLEPGVAEIVPASFIAAATVNATLLKAAPGRLLAAMFFNYSAATKYIKFYDKASAPTVGTDAPVFVLPIAASSNAALPAFPKGVKFANGIAFAVTGAAAISDVTALAAGDVVGLLNYV